MRNRIVYISILSALLLLIILGFFYGRKTAEQSEEKSGVESDTNEVGEASQNAALNENQGRIGQLAGGGSSDVVFEIQNIEKVYKADDGDVIFEASLSYPVLHRTNPANGEINTFFEAWAAEKIKEYETDETSIRQSALEVYRESKDFGWRGPWKEINQVCSVKAVDGYLSVLLESHLDEGSAHGTPYREGHVFRLSDGKKVDLSDMSKMDMTEWNALLRSRFAERIEAGEKSEFYEEAPELIQTRDMSDVGYYFSDTGIIFYLPPYEISPYSAGYVEIEVSYEEAALSDEE